MMKGVSSSPRLIPKRMNPSVDIVDTKSVQEIADFGQFQQKRRSATCDTRSRPALLNFWLIFCVVVPHTFGYHPPKYQPNSKHHEGAVNFPHFARACCLLLPKPSRSTLDAKEGYKTKTQGVKTSLRISAVVCRFGP